MTESFYHRIVTRQSTQLSTKKSMRDVRNKTSERVILEGRESTVNPCFQLLAASAVAKIETKVQLEGFIECHFCYRHQFGKVCVRNGS